MKKLSLKSLVDFRRKSDKAKKAFVEYIKSNKVEVSADGGGDYWISGVSAVCRSYKEADLEIVDEKIKELNEKIEISKHQIAKNMHQQNIAIMVNYKKMDLKKLKPASKQTYLKKSIGNPVLTIKGLEIQVKPNLIFTFGKQGEESVGVIWFVSRKDGYKPDDLGMCCELLYRFLKINYSKEYKISSQHCVVVDLLADKIVNYTEIENGEIPRVLTCTMEEINKLM